MSSTNSADSGVITPDSETKSKRAQDISWAIGLFGTAVGAGILFLPINAGVNGIWPLLIVTILIGPMTYFSHRALSRFVCLSEHKGEDITVVAEGYFGKGVGKAITFLYFMAIYPIVLIYGVGITNTFDSLIVNQINGPHIPRWILSGVLVGLMVLVMIVGQKLMLAVTQFLVYPLIIALFILSLYLIPSWHLGDLLQMPKAGLPMSVWLAIPVLVFAFNHSPAISQFSLAMQRIHGPRAAERASVVLKWTAIMLLFFTMFFVWSCVLALGADGLSAARAQNLPVLSYLANVHKAPFIAYCGPLIAIAAIVSSFFGHYMGTAEGAAGIVRAIAPEKTKSVKQRTLDLWIAAFLFLTTWLAAVLNPSILGMIETLSGPVIATILYIMPMVAIYRVERLKPYRKQLSNIFVIITGVIAISGIFLGFFS